MPAREKHIIQRIDFFNMPHANDNKKRIWFTMGKSTPLPPEERASTKTIMHLIKKWQLDDEQVWVFQRAIKAIGENVLEKAVWRMRAIGAGRLNSVEPLYTAACEATACALFSMMGRLEDDAARYILEALQEKTDDFIYERTQGDKK